MHRLALTITRPSLIAVCVVALAVASTLSTTEAAGVEPGYAGKLNGDANSRIVFQVERVDGKRSYVRLDARRFDVTCDDPQANHEVTLRWEQTTEFYFYSAHVFRGRFAIHPDPYPGYGGYFKVRGELRPRGRAKGTLSYANVKPSSAGPTCRTEEPYEWRARKR